MPLFALLPFVSTLAGGMAALRFRHRLHPFMAFASGVLVATAIVDLLPEAQALVGEERQLQLGIASLVGYLLFTLIESFIHQQHHQLDVAAPALRCRTRTVGWLPSGDDAAQGNDSAHERCRRHQGQREVEVGRGRDDEP